ncbi:MAG: hypothetical protein ABSF24_02620 [Candidatus Bathyarchaeia archaeon]
MTTIPVHVSVKTSKEKGLFSRILESFELSVKEFVLVLILLLLFNFAAYLSYVRTEATNLSVTQSSATTAFLWSGYRLF